MMEWEFVASKCLCSRNWDGSEQRHYLKVSYGWVTAGTRQNLISEGEGYPKGIV